MKQHAFPRSARLLRTADYRKVYAEGRRRSLEFLVVFAMRNGKPLSRIGLTVPSSLGGAVERNRLKRRLREAARRHLEELGPGWDLVLGPRASAKSVPFDRIEATIRELFRSCARSMDATRREG
jgi:ribonuclease P protein component